MDGNQIGVIDISIPFWDYSANEARNDDGMKWWKELWEVVYKESSRWTFVDHSDHYKPTSGSI